MKKHPMIEQFNQMQLHMQDESNKLTKKINKKSLKLHKVILSLGKLRGRIYNVFQPIHNGLYFLAASTFKISENVMLKKRSNLIKKVESMTEEQMQLEEFLRNQV